MVNIVFQENFGSFNRNSLFMEKTNNPEIYNEFYSKTDWKENYPYSKLYIKSLMALTKSLFGKKIRTIADIGCGTGIYTYTFEKQGYSAIGIDYSEVAIKKAMNKFPNCNFERQDATNLQFPKHLDMFFAKGFSLFNTNNIEDAKPVIQSWKQYLSEKGLVVIQSRTDFSRNSPNNWYFHSEDEINRMFSIDGFRTRIIYIYSKLQYLFLIPFAPRFLVSTINWFSKNMITGKFGKPSNYFVFLEKVDNL